MYVIFSLVIIIIIFWVEYMIFIIFMSNIIYFLKYVLSFYDLLYFCVFFFFFSSRRRHTRFDCDWSSDVCSSDLAERRFCGQHGLLAQPDNDSASGAADRCHQPWRAGISRIERSLRKWQLYAEIGRAACRERV